MDLTPMFIKQCIASEEIQASKLSIERGDLWCWKSMPTKVYMHSDSNSIILARKSAKPPVNTKVWIPRQDELQKILNWGTEQLLVGLTAFATRICSKSRPDYDKLLLSMEQIWLAFVMKEKYEKVWNGKYWVAGDEISNF